MAWEYLGRREIDGQAVDVLSVSSDTKIFAFLDLTSKERVYLHSTTHLPLKVERDVVMFGRKELIEEFYDQEQGLVSIKRTPSKKEEEVLRQDKPIHNILALLYFFPQDVDLEKSEWMVFNLPTQKIRIKMIRERELKVGKEKKETYFLIGRGAKRFSLWLDKKYRIPLRIEFIFPLGKITIVKQEQVLSKP